ncbi:MAG: transcriptional regulator [Spirochaetales bacterium]
MNIYFELMKHPAFSVNDLSEYYSNHESARTAVKALVKKGLATKIRSNLYTCISGETNAPVANRFQIASSITPTSCVSHHTAFEYYGVMNQVYYDVYVSSLTSFRDFTFDGYTYHYIRTDVTDEIETPEYSGGIRVTSLERTVVDSIKSMDKISGTDELIEILEICPKLDEDKLKEYIALYDNRFLWQKTGFFLSLFKERLGISDAFLDTCKLQSGKSHRYISSDIHNGKYDSDWQLVVSEKTFDYKTRGADEKV